MVLNGDLLFSGVCRRVLPGRTLSVLDATLRTVRCRDVVLQLVVVWQYHS